jgi:hypothetical protein
MVSTPEAKERLEIDAMLEAASWAVQDADGASLSAGQGVAVRGSSLSSPMEEPTTLSAANIACRLDRCAGAQRKRQFRSSL